MIVRNIKQLSSKFWYFNRGRDKKIWVFGEWFGSRCCDNAFFLANYIANNHPEIKLFWIMGKYCNSSNLHNNIHILIMDSDEAINVLKKAGVIIVVQGLGDVTNNYSFYFGGAVIVNLWHGVPWKKIGGDKLKNKLQYFYNKYWVSRFEANFYLSTSREFDEILKRGYYCSDSEIIRSGYPRNSIFYDKNKIQHCRKALLRQLINNGYKVNNATKIVTYMPTFRDNIDKVFSFEEIIANKVLQDILIKNDAIIIEKKHFVSNHNLNNISIDKKSHYVRLLEYASQDLLAASDVLITDYSSCFYDYLLLNRPIIHYLYDYDYYYHKDRGLYYKKEDVACGAIVEDEDSLIHAISESLNDSIKYNELRESRMKKYMEYESQFSCENVYKAIYSIVFES